MVADEMLMQIKKMLSDWCDEILKNEEYTKVASSYPYINVNDILANMNNNLDDLKKVSDALSLVKKYKENANYLTENETVSKLSHLFSAVDNRIDFHNVDSAKVQKIKDEQIKIRSELQKLKFKMPELAEEPHTSKGNNNKIIAISAGNGYTVGLKLDGTVVTAGRFGQKICDVARDWTDIIAISAGWFCAVGLKSNGTVVAVGDYGIVRDVKNWKDIVAISAGHFHIVGLKKDGSVVAAGGNSHGCCDVEDWRDIVAISAGGRHTVGLKKNGTVVAVGADALYRGCDVEDWSDIIAISTADELTVGLRKDGTVVADGISYEQERKMKDWKDIVAISASDGLDHVIGLKSDGTVVSTYDSSRIIDWEDIVAISAGHDHVVGLKSDRTVVATGAFFSYENIKNWDKAIN